jgi:predicted phage baseplate assembly protein
MANNFLREFEFLPNLPKSNLDDRTFNDLVQECKLRIPRYCQEWTNHNPSDPGVTLIELFAWLVDQMLLRFNQVPRLHYVAFLELLGIRLNPPIAAKTDLTFYLTKPVAIGENPPISVARGTEVATVRTETQSAVVFTTDQDLSIGQPVLKGMFTADTAVESAPLDRLTNVAGTGELDWNVVGAVRVFQNSAENNCFYLVFAPAQQESELEGVASNSIQRTDQESSQRLLMSSDSDSLHQSITGIVLCLKLQGAVAGSTGIDPNDPPLDWQVWTGQEWASGILLKPADDKTKGFSFHELQEQGRHPETEGADIILHLPQGWPEEEFIQGYSGHWIRCVYRRRENQAGYSYSPIIHRIHVSAIGGTIQATECVVVENEFLGVSNGKPGQIFQLESFPVLERDRTRERIVIKLPDGTVNHSTDIEINGILGQSWQEVDDFSNSNLNDAADSENDKRHYTLDSHTGKVQFGPLIREPSQLKYKTLQRTQLQPLGKGLQSFSTRMDPSPEPLIASDDTGDAQRREWQYGQIPPRGSEVYISSYRVGGGSRGNVQSKTLKVLKTSIPYIKSVTNHQAAKGGADEESLDEAVLRVPTVLRTAKSAIIAEDFESIARNAHPHIYKARCLPCTTPGVVQLLVILHPKEWKNLSDVDFRFSVPHGLHPDEHFSLPETIREYILQKFSDRKPLGVQVRLDPPKFFGVKVNAEVVLDQQYRSETLQPEILSIVKAALYRFLNPITGGFDGVGWEIGRSLSVSDIIAVLQGLPEVQLVSNVELNSIIHHPNQGWFLNEQSQGIIDPGPWGCICSWDEIELNPQFSRFNSGHDIQLIQP